MGILFVILLFLAPTWYYLGFELLLWIERTDHRTNWEKDTKEINWWRKPVSARYAYDQLLNSWLLSTPVWARNNKVAQFLFWFWRLGLAIIYLTLGVLVLPILIALFR